MSEILDRLDGALAATSGNDVELSIEQTRRGTVRFANSAVSQTGDVAELVVQARVAVGRRVGSARGDSLAPEALAETIARARTQAQSMAESDFPGFADGREPTPDATAAWDDRIHAATADDRVELLSRALTIADGSGLSAAGLLATSASEIAVATSAGARRQHRQTVARIDFIASSASASCRTSHLSSSLSALESQLPALSELACERTLRSTDPLELPPGTYDVVLEPPCVAELLEWLALTSFGARAVEDGSSFLAGRRGELVTGDVTIYDDASDVRPFDSEGTIKRPVTFIDHGRASACAHDRASAHRANTTPTGHAAPIADELFEGGPVPQHLHLAGGSASSVDDLVGQIDRGLLVARFHYVNGLLDTRRALMTGMTRDGLFAIERGRITRAVHNLRWTESILDAFKRIDGMTRDRQVVSAGLSDAVSTCPAILVRNWRFTG